MAKILYSGAVAEIRGSVNGWVFSRNANGGYVRNRTTPINPNTNKQAESRALMGQVIAAWRNGGKEEGHYISWAAAHPVTNSLGQQIFLTPYQLYVKRNLQLLQIGLPIATDPGNEPNFPSTTISALTLTRAVGGGSFDEADLEFTAPPGIAGMTLELKATLQLSSGVTSTRQTYRKLLVAADATQNSYSFNSELQALVGNPSEGSQIFIAAKVIDNVSGIVNQIGIAKATIGQAV